MEAEPKFKVVVNDEDLAEMTSQELAQWRADNVGFVFQGFNLLPVLTAIENVELPLVYRRVPRRARRERALRALERVGLVHRASHRPNEISGGERQRGAVARALVNEPSLVLADEPTGNLDSKNGEAVMELLDDLHQGGSTICMVTHDPRFTRHAERAVHLFDGQIVAEGAEAEAGAA